MAELVERLFQSGAAIVAFDVFFPEEERNSADTVLARLHASGIDNAPIDRLLREQRELFDNNLVFSRTLAQHDVVLGFVFYKGSEESKGMLPQPLSLTDHELALQSTIPAASGFTSNIATLQRASQGGFFSLWEEDNIDGVIRRAPMLLRHGDAFYSSLSLEAVRQYYKVDKVDVVFADIGGQWMVEGIALAGLTIPTDPYARALVPYRGKQGSFPYISASDIFSNNGAHSETLNDAIVLIGTTARGLFDLRATPVQSVYPGVEVHANLIAGMLDGSFPVEPSWAPAANLLFLFVAGFILSLILPRLQPVQILIFSSVIGAVLIYLNLWFWTELKLVISLAPGLFLIAVLTLLNMSYGYFLEATGRKRLEGMFGQYVPSKIVEVMSEDPDSYSFEGESRELTVLFSDVRSFTTVSESLPANELKRVLNEFFTPMTKVIFETSGTVDKYVGDMVMAFWGAPVEDALHARHAVEAGLMMQQESKKLREQFKEKGWPQLHIGVGINTGTMNVGDMGSEYRRAYTVLGDSVNLGSRLEGLTKFYRVEVAVGEETWKQTAEHFIYRELDSVRVKGKHDAVRVFEPVCRIEEATDALKNELTQHEQALHAFRHRDWDSAEKLFKTLFSENPEHYLYALYLERIDSLRSMPPGDDWDGVFERTEK